MKNKIKHRKNNKITKKKFSFKFKDKKRKIILLSIIFVFIIIFVSEIVYLVKSDGFSKLIYSAGLTEKSQADKIKKQGVRAFHDGEIEKAKDLLNDAKQKYQKIGDTNGEVDADALIWLVEHP